MTPIDDIPRSSATPPAGRARSPRASFWSGVTAPGLLWLLGGLVLAVAAMASLEAAVSSGAYTAIGESHLLLNHRDDYTHVAYTVSRLKRHPPSGTPVYFLGGSSTREMIDDPARMAADLSARAGTPVEVYDLASNDQSFGTDMTIVDNLPRTGGVVVLSVGVQRFIHGPTTIGEEAWGKPVALPPRELRRYLRERYGQERWAFTILPGVFDHLARYVKKWSGELARGDLPTTDFWQHYYTEEIQFTPEEKRQRLDDWLANRGAPGGQFDKVFEYDAGLLEHTVKLARERGFTVVLSENPADRETLGNGFARMEARYRPLLQRLADQYGAGYVDVNGSAGLVSDDFVDLTHLLGPGGRKFTDALAGELAPFVSVEAGGDGAEGAGGAGTPEEAP